MRRSSTKTLNHALPPPMSFKSYLERQNELVQSKSKSLISSIIVSPAKPHKILSVSDNVAKILQFASTELCGRTVRVIQGPNSDSVALDAAIRASGFKCCQRIAFSFYTRFGEEQSANVFCKPLFEKNGKLYACTLEVRFQRSSDKNEFKHTRGEDRYLTMYAEQNLAAQRRNNNYRVLYNFRTGLSIHQAYLNQKQKKCSDEKLRSSNGSVD
jgi:hypothetical protein